MNKLPNEMLAEVFLQCLNNTPSFDASASTSHYITPFGMQSPPWNLSHVCSRWRTVTTSLPALWSHISLSQSTEAISSCQRFSLGIIQLIQTCLERSRNILLRFQFDVPFDSNPCRWDAIRTLFEHTDRFEVLEITSINHDACFTTISQTFTHLKALRFEPKSWAAGWLVDILRNTPMLHTLSISTLWFPPSFAELGSFGSHLTRLVFGNSTWPCDVKSALMMMSSLPAIQEAEFWLSLSRFEEEDLAMEGPVVVISRSLSSLTLTSNLPIGPLLTAKLVLPSLQKMTMYTGDNLCHISSLIERSGCSIHSLDIDIDSKDTAELSELLAATPELHTLAINIYPTTPIPPIIDILAVQVDKAALCPHLDNLQLIWSCTSLLESRGEPVFESVANVVHSRLNVPAVDRRLRALKLTIEEDDSSERSLVGSTDNQIWSHLCDLFSEASLVELWRVCYHSNEETDDVVRFLIEVFGDGNKWTARPDSSTSPAERIPHFEVEMLPPWMVWELDFH